MTQTSSTEQLQARFQLLVLPHLDRLVAFAYRRTGNTADAEDAVQESCIKAWQGFAELRDEACVRSWLYRIVRSVLSDFREKRGRRDRLVPTVQLESSYENLAASSDPGPFEQLVASISKERAYEALHIIPEEFALAVELHDIEGFRYREIAEITGVALGTVMSRIYRGRKMLAALIVTNAGSWDLLDRDTSSATRSIQKRHA